MKAIFVLLFLVFAMGTVVAEERPEKAADDAIRITDSQAELIGLETTLAKESRIAIEVWLNGEVTANQDRTLQVLPKAGGVVVEIKKTLGDEVAANETLALIESQDVPAASAAYLVARSKADLAQKQLQRHETLWLKKVIAEEEYLSSKQTATEAQVQLRAATQRLTLLGIDPETVTERSSAGVTSARVPVLSPVSGTIIEKKIAVGDQVTNQTPLYRVANLERVWVMANAFERDMGYLSVGQSATVTLKAYPNRKFQGMVTWVSQVLDEKTRTLAVRVELDNSEKLLKPGSFARVLVLVPMQKTSVTVPPTAVQRQKKDQIVFVDEGNGLYQRRLIKTKLRTANEVEVIEGLKAGEKVVTTGSFILKSELEKSSFGGE